MSANSTESFWLEAWYQGRWWLWLLWPLSVLLKLMARLRRNAQASKAQPLAVPVIVVGNITLGGTGKTPVIISLVQYLREKGYRPGVLSRGYGGSAPSYPYLVTADSPVSESGDEPLLIALEAKCPVMVGADRVASANALIDEHQCDVLLSDDGLQHYRLSRQWEICVLDAERLWGNGLCLPAGPLRESPDRLKEVDCIVLNGHLSVQRSAQLQTPSLLESAHTMALTPRSWHRVSENNVGDDVCTLGALEVIDEQPSQKVFAITGIGNPKRFFTTLSRLGLNTQNRSFPDHYAFDAEDLNYIGDDPLLMTAKDAVKCRGFAKPKWWYLSVSADLPDSFWAQLDEFLSAQSVVGKFDSAG